MKLHCFLLKSLGLFFTALICSSALFGCSENQSTANTDAYTDSQAITDPQVPKDIFIGGYIWNMEQGAEYSDSVLECYKGSKAICSDSNLPNTYILECDITATQSSDSGIAINNTTADYHYILEINATTDKVQLNKYYGDKRVTVASADFDCVAEAMYHVKMVVNASSIKLYLNPIGEQEPDYQIIDVMIDKFRPNYLSFVSTNDDIRIKNIELRSNDMRLEPSERYTNPIITGADPYVLFHDGIYYLYSTNAVNEGYKVFTSTDLKTWEDRGLCLKTIDVYGTPTPTAGFWAPEVYNYNDKFYLIYTVEEHLGIAVADSPLGPFKSPKQSFLSSKKEIDGHLFFDDDGKVYIYFVRCGSSVGAGTGNEIFGAEFDMETLTYKNEKCILYPEANTWEWIGDHGYVAEGPAVLKHEGRYYLTYSANGYTSQDYAIGLAISDSPLGTYQKYDDNPILKKSTANNVYGPGHHCFTYSPDGSEMFIVYHKHYSASQIHSRVTCTDRAYFKYNETLGYDVLNIIGPTSTSQPLPSGMTKE